MSSPKEAIERKKVAYCLIILCGKGAKQLKESCPLAKYCDIGLKIRLLSLIRL